MTKNHFTIILSFLFTNFIIAQTATLSGIVKDAKTGEGLFAATVQIGNTGVTTDFDGSYELKLEEGTYDVEISYVGYETLVKSVSLKSGEKSQMDFELGESLNVLNTATVTSGRFDKALGEVTVSLEVIKPDLLERTNQTSISGVLEKVPGVNLVGDQANIRGGSGFSYGAGSRVLLLVDDIPILQADAGFPQWEDVPFENLEQIEVVKGAASALYGSSALNGIINARTAYAKSDPVTKVSPFYTIFFDPKNEGQAWWNTQPYATGASISHKRKIGKLDLVVGGFLLKRESTNQFSESNRFRWNSNLRYRITDRLTVGLNGNFARNNGSGFFFWGGLDDLLRTPGPNTVSDNKSFRFNVDPFITYFDKANNRHKLSGRFFSVNNENDTEEADQSNTSDVYYGEYQFQRRFEGLDLVTSAGLVYQRSNVRAPLYGDTTLVSENYAAYLQLDKKLGDKINLSAGFRYENNEIRTPEVFSYSTIVGGFPYMITDTVPGGMVSESKPVFRFGLNYQIDPTTFARFSWGQGYRFPTIAEKFIFTTFGGIPINPNFDLNSETGWTAEIGFKKGIKISEFSGFVDLAFFQSEYQDMMEFIFVGLDFFNGNAGFQSQNVGNTIIRGSEISIGGQGKLFGIDTRILAGYTYIDPKFKEFDINAEDGTEAHSNASRSSLCNDPEDPQKLNCENVLKYRSKHTVKFDVESTVNNLSIGVTANYRSHMANIDQEFETLIVPGLREWRKANNNGFLVIDLRASYQVTDLMKCSLLWKNLTNIEHVSRPGLLQPTANFTFRLDYKF